MSETVQVFDGHNDTILKLELASRSHRPRDFTERGKTLDIDLPRARAAGFAGGLFAMYTPSVIDRSNHKYDRADPRHFAQVPQDVALSFTMALFARMHLLAASHPDKVAITTSTGAAREAMAANRLAMVPHIEGAECIDENLDALEVLHAAGLRSLGLVWSRPNAFGDGAPMARQPELDPGKGLSTLGRELVRACNGLGIMVDVSHLTEQGFWDVAEITGKPLVASHSNAHALAPNARNLTDRQLDAIAESGGLVGLNFHVAFLREDCRIVHDTPVEVMIRHLDHLLGRLGETGVGLGSDFDGCELPRAIGDVTGLPRLVEAMRAAGYGEALINRICHENWLDLLERTIG